MKGYYRVMLGKKSAHAPEYFAGGFIGADFGIPLPEGRRIVAKVEQLMALVDPSENNSPPPAPTPKNSSPPSSPNSPSHEPS